jgi:hypothetical protein
VTVLYPIGYGNRLGTIQEVIQYMSPDWIEPEYAERIQAWFISRKGEIGPGGAMRYTQPDKPGFAPAGMSFHLRQYFGDGAYKYMACDLVHRNGLNVHRSPTWAEVPQQGTAHPDISNYGVHCNVNGEPWHMQCIEVDGFQTWVNLGKKHPNPNFPINQPTPPVGPPTHEGEDEVGFLIVDTSTGNYYSVGASGISGVPSFAIRDALFSMQVISNKEPYEWHHDDVMALLNTEDLRPPA